MKIAISGGHFTPAYAIIQELKKNDILVIGRKFALEGSKTTSFEYNVCSKFDIEFREIHAGRLTRNFSMHTALLPIRLPRSIIESTIILKKFRPDVVVVFGGYIALPVALSAYFLKIPIVMHEQTQKAGLANRIISNFATRICISFEQSRRFFPQKRTVLTGNPLRREIFDGKLRVNIPEGKRVIYITGGSTGSHFINNIIGQIAQDLLASFVLVHQTGDNQFEDFENLDDIRNELPDELKKRYVLQRFFHSDEVGGILKRADLVVSRAGINIVSEILALGKMSLLIPLPYGQTNEQKDNAMLVQKLGLGKLITQDKITPKMLKDTIHDMMVKKANFLENKSRARRLVIDGAAKKLIDEIKDVYEKSKKSK